MGRLRHGGQHTEHAAVVFARVRLAGYRQGAFKAHLLRHALVDSLHLVDIVIAQAHKTGLGAGGALGAAKMQRRQHVFQVFKIEYQILQPQHGAAADGGQLGRLKVGVSERHDVPLRGRKPGQGVHDVDQTGADQLQTGAHLDKISVIAHEGTGGTQVDNAARPRALRPISVYVRHDVVPQNFLLRLGDIVIDVLYVRPQLFDLRLAYVQPHLRFGLGERDPQAAPGLKLELGREEVAHVLARVTLHQGVYVPLIIRCRACHRLHPLLQGIIHEKDFGGCHRWARAKATALRKMATP